MARARGGSALGAAESVGALRSARMPTGHRRRCGYHRTVRRLLVLLAALSALAPSAALATGGHDKVGCIACHGIKGVDRATAAFCLHCHATKEQGGQDVLPIDRHVSHPFGLDEVNPKVALVPTDLLRADGRFECLSCHEPHPSNQNWAYLRVDTGKKGRFMDPFCVTCHPRKGDQSPGALQKNKGPQR